MQADRAFVIECYRRILGREPENEAAVDQVLRGGKDIWAMIALFTDSQEFRSRAAKLSSYSLGKAFDPRGLARNLSDDDRMRSILSTYSMLTETLGTTALKTLFSQGLTVYSGSGEFADVTTSLTLFEGSPIEGELSLIASYQGRRVAILTFTYAPADILGLPGAYIILISRIQGYVGVGDDTRALTRRLGGISPPYLLMAILEGIAAGLGCRTIVGVSAEQHPDYREEYRAAFVAAYDDFFSSLCSTRLSSGLHLMTSPLEGRPLSRIARSHRSRTRRKRTAKQAITRAAQTSWQRYLRSIC